MQLESFNQIYILPNDWFKVCLLGVCKTFLLKIFLNFLRISCTDVFGVYNSSGVLWQIPVV